MQIGNEKEHQKGQKEQGKRQKEIKPAILFGILFAMRQFSVKIPVSEYPIDKSVWI
jgi:hypothetical protein